MISWSFFRIGNRLVRTIMIEQKSVIQDF